MAKTILLKDIPPSTMKAIKKEQSMYDEVMDVKLNLSKIVIKMLRDYLKCKSDNNFKPDAQ